MQTDIKALIIDDELFAREAINVYLKKHPYIRIMGECTNGLEALNSIQLHKPDLIFLDIQMPELNGFEVLAELDHQPLCIIFTTAYDNFALKAFDARAIDYLLKPFDQERFDDALSKALYYFKGRTKDQVNDVVDRLVSAYKKLSTKNDPEFLSRILIKEPRKYFFVKVEEIVWFEAAGDYVTIHTEGKKHLIHDSLNKLDQRLDPEKFVRIHRSTIVNLEYIKELQPHFNGEFFITLRNGAKVKLSRTYREAAKHIFGTDTDYT